MPRKANPRNISAKPISDDLWAGWRAQVLVAAIELDVFTHLAARKRTVGQIAAATHATPRGIRGLLDALVAMDYLGKRADCYKLHPMAEVFLVKGRESYLGAMADVTRSMWPDWAHLADAIRTGRPCSVHTDPAVAGKLFRKLAGSLFAVNSGSARAAVEALSPKLLKRVHHILDVAAGSGAWSIPFAQALPEVRVTAFDLPPVLKVTRQFASRLGVAGRYTFLKGDIEKADFGRESFDLILLGHILHGLGRAGARELIEKCAAALRAGGAFLIAEFVPNDARTGPLIPMLFGLSMFLHTREGDVFTFREYSSWLKAAGLHNPRTLRVPAVSPLILATK
jgi:ubiquinone/menaquinone biosynthesis C-methylase UbiE